MLSFQVIRDAVQALKSRREAFHNVLRVGEQVWLSLLLSSEQDARHVSFTPKLRCIEHEHRFQSHVDTRCTAAIDGTMRTHTAVRASAVVDVPSHNEV